MDEDNAHDSWNQFSNGKKGHYPHPKTKLEIVKSCLLRAARVFCLFSVSGGIGHRAGGCIATGDCRICSAPSTTV